MKKKITILAFAILASFGLFAQQTLLSAWTFDDLPTTGTTSRPLVLTANSGLGELSASASIYADGTNGSSAFINTAGIENSEITSFGGYTLNDPRTTANASASLALANQSANGKSIVFKFSTLGYDNIVMTFAIRGTGTGFSSHAWAYSTNGTTFTDFPTENTADREGGTTARLRTVDFSSATEINNQATVYIRLTIDGCTSVSGNNRFDNILIKGTSTGPDIYPPRLTGYEVVNPTTLKLTFNEALKQTVAETNTNYVFAGETNVTAAVLSNNRIVTLTIAPALTEGQSSTLTIKNIEDLADNVMADSTFTFTFGVPVAFHKATLAELRAMAPSPASNDSARNGTVVYKFTGEAIITYMMTNRNQKYIQDNTGAILIDDQSGILADEFAMGDKLTDIYGKLTNYYGMFQFTPTQKAKYVDSHINTTPEVIVLTDFNNLHTNPIQAKLVKVEGVRFTATGNFGKGQYYGLQQNGVTCDSIVFTTNYNADYIDTPIPTIAVSLTGVVNYARGKNRLIVLNKNSMVSIHDINVSTLALSPNPAIDYIRVSTSEPQKLEIYSIAGQLVSTQQCVQGDNIIPVAHLSKGLYIVKLTNDLNGKIQSAKLVVQ